MAKKKPFLGGDDDADDTPGGKNPEGDPVDGGAENDEAVPVGVVEGTSGVERKPWLMARDPKVPLSPEDAKLIDAHEERVYQYNLKAKLARTPQALTKEEQDLIP